MAADLGCCGRTRSVTVLASESDAESNESSLSCWLDEPDGASSRGSTPLAKIMTALSQWMLPWKRSLGFNAHTG